MFSNTLDKMVQIRDEKQAEDGGFTLIELLVVVVIIGILIAIAIPLYLNYEKGSHDSGAESDLRAAVTDVTQCYSTNSNAYPLGAANVSGQETYYMTTATTGACSTTTNLSTGTVLAYVPVSGGGFAMLAKNTQGTSNVVYYYNSATGQGVGPAPTTGLPAGLAFP